MASMERVSYPPLVAHLQQRAGYYNALYADYELRYGAIEKDVLHKWAVQVIEPVIVKATTDSAGHLPSVFEALFSETLYLLGSGKGTAYEDEYKKAWLLCKQVPLLVRASPARLIKGLHSALLSIRTYQPAKVAQWLTIMESTITGCGSVEQFLDCGRVAAWFCGLSHLKNKCRQRFPLLPVALQNNLRKACPLPISLEASFDNCWTTASPQFVGEAGGFTGFGGAFIAPPLLSCGNEYIIATDTVSSYALFADAFGKVLLPYSLSGAGGIVAMAATEPIKVFKIQYGDILKFNDISSSVLTGSTLYFTRHSSHYIYIYGWHYNNKP